MGAPGFWDDQERAAAVSAKHARAQQRLETLPRARARRRRPRRARRDGRRGRRARGGARVAARLDRVAGWPSSRRRACSAATYDAGDAVVTVRVRRRRHRLPGLGRDAAAHVPALGRAARLRGRDEGGVGGRGGGDQVGDASSPRARTPMGCSRPSAASTGWSGSLPSTPNRVVIPPSPRSTSRRWSTTRSRSTSTRRTYGSIPIAPRVPGASTSTRPTPPSASPTSRPGSSSSARTSARRRRTRRPRCGC